MPKPLIHFDESQLNFHQNMLDLTSRIFGQYIVPNIPIMNDAPGPNQKIATVIDNIKKVLQVEDDANNFSVNIFKHSPQTHESLSNNISSPEFQLFFSVVEQRSMSQQDIVKQYYTMLNKRFMMCNSMCSYLISTYKLDEQRFLSKNSDDFRKSVSYLLLLACITAFNAAIIYQDENEHENVENLIGAIKKWLHLLETEYLTHNQSGAFRSLHDTFVKQYQTLLVNKAKKEKNLNLSLGELGFHVNRKNTRANTFGSPYHGKVIIESHAKHFESLAPESTSKLMGEIKALSNPDSPSRKQFLFYPNSHVGPVEVLDVQWDNENERFDIIHLHSSNDKLQYDLLRQLGAQLNDANINYRILACQTDLQDYSQKPTSLHAYALSGIISKLSFNMLFGKSFTEQPGFSNYAHPNGKQFEPIEKVRWFKLSDMGPKAVMMANTHTPVRGQRLLTQLRDILPASISPLNKLRTFYRKYNLQTHISTGNAYFQALHQRLHQRQHGEESDPLDQILTKLDTQDKGQALRSAIELCTTDEFEYLIKRFKSIIEETPVVDAQDKTPGQHYSPLHIALRDDKATRAVKLRQLGQASIIVKDDTPAKQTARDIYEQASDGSEVKRNRVLRGLMQG